MTDKLEERKLLFSGTLSEEDRTVEVCWSTGARVKRYSYDDGYYWEELQVDAKSIRMDRFEAMSLLDSHDSYSMDSRLGTVVPGSVRFAGGKAYARIKFSKKQRAEEIFQDVRDGLKLAISVGYKIHRYEKTEGADGQLPVLRATDWEPMELSAVPIPADAGAFSRSEEGPHMPQTQTTTEPQTRGEILKERKRVSDLTFLARSAKITDTELDAAIEAGTSADEFRRRALDAMIERQDQAPTFPIVETVEYGQGLRSVRADVMADALMVRVDASQKPQDAAREFVGLSIPELARRCLEARGELTSGSGPASLVTRALHTTSDFPGILAGLANKRLQQEFTTTSSALKRVAHKSTARDFKAKTISKLSSMPDLKKVNEHGEFTRGTMLEDSESYRIDTFGRIFGITRQALINDDLGAFDNAARKFAQAASVFESKFLVNLVESNPKMSDGNPVFHATHKNLMTASALDLDSLKMGRLLFRQQVGLAGDLVDLKPKYLIVSADLETSAEMLLAAINPTDYINVNPFSNRLELVVEPRLSGRAWYLAADPAACEGLEYAYLEGFETPHIETRAGFDVDGVETKVRLDFGAGLVEHRGWVKNPGL